MVLFYPDGSVLYWWYWVLFYTGIEQNWLGLGLCKSVSVIKKQCKLKRWTGKKGGLELEQTPTLEI
jgi:hypothetical protein